MNATFLCLFFLITFSCEFARARSLRDSEDNNFLTLDTKILPSALVEEIMTELSAEQAKNRDLNQTISDILEEMEDMKKNILILQEDVVAVQDDVVSVAEEVEQQETEIRSLATRGTWCAIQPNDWTAEGIISYENLTYSDSNMNVTGTPLAGY